MPETYQCIVCGKVKNREDIIPAGIIRNAITNLIKKDFPGINNSWFICAEDLNNYRTFTFKTFLKQKRENLQILKTL